MTCHVRKEGVQISSSYDYCGISNPWLQIKLLRFMQLVPITDPQLRSSVLKVCSNILNSPHDQSHDSENYRSARNAILMECFGVCCMISDSPPQLISKSIELLVNGFTQSSSSPNIIILSLSKLSSLCSKNLNNVVHYAAQHYQSIVALLHCADAEMKLKAYQLLLSIRTDDNTNQLVQDMLKIIATQDPILQFPMACFLSFSLLSSSKTNTPLDTNDEQTAD